MMKIRPKPSGVPIEKESLTPEESFVLARIDGHLSVNDLAAMTGIEERRVEQIVTKLANEVKELRARLTRLEAERAENAAESLESSF